MDTIENVLPKDMFEELKKVNKVKFQTEFVKKNSLIVSVDVVINSINIDNVPVLYCSARDISDILKYEELKEIQKLAKIGSWTYDILNDNLKWSDETYNIFEQKKDEIDLNFEVFMELVHENDRSLLENMYKQSITLKEDYELDHRIVLKNGEIKWVKEKCNNVFNDNGEVIYSNGMVQDITLQKQQEERQNQQQAMLIHQNRLAQLGEMVSMIAHQWRQPLSTLSTWKTNLVMYCKDEYGEDETIKMIEKKMNHPIEFMTNTITNFADFYKVNKTKQSFNIKKAVENTIEIIDTNVSKNSINIKLDLDEDLTMNSFEGEFKQIVLVILNNAIEALDTCKTKDIKILTYKKDKKIYLNISDTGPGISKEIEYRVFEPYFSTKNEKNGTGLGLYMVKNIIEKSFNGKIYFETSKEGTSFTIELPF